MSRGVRALMELRDPRKALMADLRSAKEILHLNHPIMRE